MDIQLFADNLREALDKKLKTLNPDQDDLLALGQLLSAMRDTIRELKDFVATYAFQSQAEEITFFREIKPAFISQYLYHKKLFALRWFDSFRDSKARQLNYHMELKKLADYATRNKDFYQYYLTGATDLDKQYFLRGGMQHDALNRDEKFSTGFDTRLARIQANEMLRSHMQKKLTEENTTSTLTWSESKVALIELIYALHYAKAVNGGSADIKVIATAFESCFNISLGNYYRVFQDIRLRKTGVTPFLDLLRKRLQNHIDNMND